MKKLFSIIAALMLTFSLTMAQPVSDMGIIPVGVTLNSILRLNISKGGNIEFVVSTISQFEQGIPNSDIYDTKFTVASSVDFDVYMYADNTHLVGQANPTANLMPLDNIGFTVSEDGSGVPVTNWSIQSVLSFLNNVSSTRIVIGVPGLAAGDGLKNSFIINWELATSAVVAANTTKKTLLAQSLAGDRYIANVYLLLQKK